MRTMADREAEERRGYYRLLRYLLRDELEAEFKDDETKPLPQDMVDLLRQLDEPEQNSTH